MITPQMDPIIKGLWITALLDGNSVQGQGMLGYETLEDGKPKRCCLGVLCDLAVLAGVIPSPYDDPDRQGLMYGDGDGKNNAFLPASVQRWAGLADANPVVYLNKADWVGEFTLTGMNDEGHNNFTEIATAIAKSL